MLLRPQPCCWPLILVLLVQTMLGLGLVGAVPATRAPGGRRRSTTTTPRPTPASTAPACASTTTVPSTATPALAAPPAGPPTVSLAATNSTWPKHFVGPPDLPGRPTPVGPPPGGGAGGNVKDNLIEEDDSVTCYTCVNVSDNIVCNAFAIDTPCPKGEDFCHTLHITDSRGNSVLVNKKCATVTECDPVVLGCLHIDTQTVCASCCDESYCNETVPTNRTASFYSATKTRTTPPPTGRAARLRGSASAAATLAALAAPLGVWLGPACGRAG